MIKGVVLRNFMSYSNASVPLYPGLNLIAGPNGAGKSSILLAISLVLGQAYTERSRKLSDLIRWGEDQARISLLIDNSPREGKRPFPQYHTDTVEVTRILRKGGEYGYLLQGKPTSKEKVVEVFNRIGVNPNNMLIIMHQLMVGRFASISPQEKLRMLEEAVGFESYRADVIDADTRLRKVLSEEESLAAVLESTQETYQYWKKEYEKYQKKKELENKMERLQSELIWSRVERRQAALAKLDDRIESRKRAIELTEAKIGEAKEALGDRRRTLSSALSKRHQLEERRVQLEQVIARTETDIKWAKNQIDSIVDELATLSQVLAGLENSVPEQGAVSPLIKSISKLKERLESRRSELEGLSSSSSLKDARAQLASIVEELDKTRRATETAIERVIEARVQFEVLQFKKKLLSDELRSLQAQRRVAMHELTPLVKRAERLAPRPTKTRNIVDIEAEIAATEEQLKPLAHISEEVEKMYSSYVGLVKDLKEKAELVAKNREEVLHELAKRFDMWKTVVGDFLSQLGERYNRILSSIGASGTIRLVDAKDIEKAGLELLVSFKGGRPTPIDGLTQSGGERSVALMAFLLALQQHIRSPFRAIDEFDVHMDPRNREMVSDLIVSSFKEAKDEQYLAITPGQIEAVKDNVHVIVVQNVSGLSEVAEVR
jgi:chromosome segregation ATPase